MVSKPTPAVKRRYNQSAYRRYEFSVKVDTRLNYLLENYISEPQNSLSELIRSALSQYFGVDGDEIYVPYHFQRDSDGEWVQLPNTDL